MKTVVKMLFGSHLYGTDTPSSDTDIKSIYIPDAKDILLQRVQPEIVISGREKAEGERNTPDDVDNKAMSLQHFLRMASEGQTLAIDMLFAPKEMIEETSGWWRHLVRNRHRLISKKSAAFLGYCRQQANKYGIKGSRVAAAKLAHENFSYAESYYGSKLKVGEFFGMTMRGEHLLKLRELFANEHVSIAQHPLGSTGTLGTFFECCGRKVAYNASVKQAAEIYGKIYQNYGDRARLAESNEGVDWKALSHAVRVGTEAKELLTTGHVTLPLLNAEHLKNIKLGKLPYKQVSEEIEHLLVEVEMAAQLSTLPDEPDFEFMDEVVMDAYSNRVKSEYLEQKWSREVYGPRPMIDESLDLMEKVYG